jgi:hypothetical protein
MFSARDNDPGRHDIFNHGPRILTSKKNTKTPQDKYRSIFFQLVFLREGKSFRDGGERKQRGAKRGTLVPGTGFLILTRVLRILITIARKGEKYPGGTFLVTPAVSSGGDLYFDQSQYSSFLGAPLASK